MNREPRAMDENDKAYAEGVRNASKAIDRGNPRWLEAESFTSESIHPGTGLPIARLMGPPELAARNRSYADGNNDEVLAAFRSGAVDTDLRALHLTREEVETAMDTACLGTLSVHRPRLQFASGDAVLELRRSRSKKKPLTWICYSHASFGRWPSLALFEEPIRFAIARDGGVLISESTWVYLTRCVQTTQVIDRFPRDRAHPQAQFPV